MSDAFEPGEVAIWQNLGAPDEDWNGEECMVVSQMQWGEYYDPFSGEENVGIFYDVRDISGDWIALPWELRKKHSPGLQIELRDTQTVGASHGNR